MPMHGPEEVQPYYPWSLAWRDDNDSVTTADLLEVSAARSRRRGWLDPTPSSCPWLPPDEPVRHEALRASTRRASESTYGPVAQASPGRD